MMGHRQALVVVALMLFCGGLTAAWSADAVARAQLVKVVGTVKVQRGGTGPAVTVSAPEHRMLYPGDRVQTMQRASCVILIDDTRVSLGPATVVAIPNGREAPPTARARRVWTVIGRVFIWLIGGRHIEIGSQAAVAAAQGTRFVLEVAEDGTTVITVLEGAVSFYNDQGEVTVAEGQQSTARPGQAPTRPMRVDPSGYIQYEAGVDTLWLDWEHRYQPGRSAEDLRGQLQSLGAPETLDAAGAVARGRLLHDLGDAAGAEVAFGTALALDPGNPEATLGLGLALLAQGRVTEAVATLQEAVRLAPGNALAAVALAAAQASSGAEGAAARARATLATVRDGGAPAATLTGILAMREGDVAAARAALERAVAADSSAYQARAQLAMVALAEGNLAAAAAEAEQAVRLAPTSALAWTSRAAVAFFAEEQEEAAAAARAALTINPESASAHLVLSDIAVAAGDLDAGMGHAQLAVTLDPGCAPAWSALGMIYLARNDLKAAEKAFARALALSPQMISARTGMGLTYQRQGRLAQAVAAQKAAVALDTSSAAVHNNLGAALLAQGHLEEAVAQFEAALERQPGFSLAYANLALARLDQNRFAEAQAAAQRAIELGENSARTWTTAARVYSEQGRDEMAAIALRQAIELDESYALAHLQLAEVYLRQDRARDALRHQISGITEQPSGIAESRAYARTEITLRGGSFSGALRTDGRFGGGNGAYFLSGAWESEDWGRPHTDRDSGALLGIVGRQVGTDRTEALLLSWQTEDRDRPGRDLGGGVPEDPNYYSEFDAWQARYLTRQRSGSSAAITAGVGYTDTRARDTNPDALDPDPKPFRELRLEYTGPWVEARLDRWGQHSRTTAGGAFSGETRRVAGTFGPPTGTVFDNSENRSGATLYLWHRQQIGPETEVMAGGRAGFRQASRPVLRPEAYVRRQLGDRSTLVLLARPVLRDDVSELSPGWTGRCTIGSHLLTSPRGGMPSRMSCATSFCRPADRCCPWAPSAAS